MIQMKEHSMGLQTFPSSLIFFSSWGRGSEVAKNETRESQITGKIFKTRFSQTLIPVSL